MHILWTDGAKREFDELTAYIAEDSLKNAMLVRRRILQASRLLGSSPLIGTPDPRSNNRTWVVTNTGFVLRYRVGTDAIAIISVIRGKRHRT